MKVADLYIRVSTEEQADKGYSQRDQEERLRKYCEINLISVRKVIYEDHSAKNFKRPAWLYYLKELRRCKNQSDLVLFTKWDRFSRNAGDAYQMISTLRKHGVEPQAIEQPLDITIPENKMMLAFYLAAPEVENDRRALNTFHGMRRAKKEGRWMATAPIGYINKTSENGKKYIAIKEPEASIIRWAFKELSNGVYAIDQVRKMTNKKGLKCSRNSFNKLVKNPVYCGKIIIPKYRDEEAYMVQGQHEAIISDYLFHQVQDVIKKRKSLNPVKILVNEKYPLRGFLLCKCGQPLTGSASKGKLKHYNYYHSYANRCSCNFRINSEKAEKIVLQELNMYSKSLPPLKLYKKILTQVYKIKNIRRTQKIDHLKSLLKIANDKMRKARELLLTDTIDANDFRVIKSECADEIFKIESELSVFQEDNINLSSLLEKAYNCLSMLDILYLRSDIIVKRKLISSLFPQKLTIISGKIRTPKINEALALTTMINKYLQEHKKGEKSNKIDFSPMVTAKGFKPPTLRAEI